jgi:hypothetical protein
MRRYHGIVSLFLVLLVSACSPGYKLATQYIKHQTDTILIIPSYELFKDNLTIRYDTNVIYSPNQFDSIAWEQSLYIRHVSDSVFLTTYTNSLIKALSEAGYTVFIIDSTESPDSLPDSKWKISIAQLQLNEERTIEQIELPQPDEYDGPVLTTKPINVNRVYFDSWFKVSPTGKDTSQLLYFEAWGEDSFSSETKKSISGFARDSVVRDSITMDEVYVLAELMGEKHAELLFNYFLNQYIIDKSPPENNRKENYYYIRKRKSLLFGPPDQFDHFDIITPGD